jgi:hypothetical protein
MSVCPFFKRIVADLAGGSFSMSSEECDDESLARVSQLQNFPEHRFED